ncbi:hypothetical protein [Synechococcus sp. 1G10]|nr:hypothetical protein [Synechococcus sp. 1G10]
MTHFESALVQVVQRAVAADLREVVAGAPTSSGWLLSAGLR